MKCLIFVVQLLLVSASKKGLFNRRCRWSKAVPNETPDQLAQSIFVPLPDTISSSRYPLYCYTLPEDLMHRILYYLDPIGVWNAGLSCKNLGAFVRERGSGLVAVLQSENVFPYLLWSSELTIYKHMLKILIPFIQPYINTMRGSRDGRLQKTLCVMRAFRDRAGDFGSASIPNGLLWNVPDSFCINDAIAEHLWGSSDPWAVYYMPPRLATGEKFLDRVDVKWIPQIMSNPRLDKMFSFAILFDYIVPSSTPPRFMSAEEQEVLRHMCTDHSGFLLYFDALNYAIQMVTGASRINSIETRPIRNRTDVHLKKFGLNSTIRSAKFSSMTPLIPAVLLVAKHWDLNWMYVARRTCEWSAISKEIVAGNVPEYLKDDSRFSYQELYTLFTGKSLQRVRLQGTKLVPLLTSQDMRVNSYGKRVLCIPAPEIRPSKQPRLSLDVVTAEILSQPIIQAIVLDSVEDN